MKTPHRVAPERKPMARARPTDGPFAETKELIGGCLSATAQRGAAAALAARNLCVVCGRQIDPRLLVDSAPAHHPHHSR